MKLQRKKSFWSKRYKDSYWNFSVVKGICYVDLWFYENSDLAIPKLIYNGSFKSETEARNFIRKNEDGITPSLVHSSTK